MSKPSNILEAHPIEGLCAASSLSETLAEKLAAEHYGLITTASRLNSERDQNFRLRTADCRRYVLKIANPAEDRAVTNMQTEALLHLEAKATDLPVPRISPALSGATEIGLAFEDGSTRTVRLLSYLEGTPLHTVGPSAALLRDLGHCAGRLARGLRDFAHTGVRHKLLWDLQHAGELRPLVDSVSHQQRGAVEDVLGRFEMHALPVLAGLDRQAVHNDLNPHNIVVDPNRGDRIAGIIDFGDLAFTARINDLAIAAAYQVADGDDPLEPACELIAAYHQVSPLDPVERDILFDLIATRIVMTIVIASFRAVRHPENRVYILRNYQGALVRLGRIARLSRNEARLQIARACRSE